MTKHQKMVAEMAERSYRLNRSNPEKTAFKVTNSDMRRLKAVSFPINVLGYTFEYDDEVGTLLKVTSEGVPQEPTAEDEPTTESTPDLPLAEEGPIASDLLMWVGYEGYPTIEEFVSEANRLGVSKRISRVPKGVEVGATRVFLAHDEGIKGDAVIFGFFVIERVEVLVEKPGDSADHLKGVAVEVLVSDSIREEERGCGHREDPGAIYLVRHEDMSTMPSEGKVEIGGSSSLTIFSEPRDYNLIIDEDARRFRSFRRVNGDKILESNLTKDYPTNRSEKTVNIDPDKLPKKKQAWTDEERSELARLISEREGLYSAFKEFARQTNRSLRSIEYQYFKNIRGLEERVYDEV